MVGIWIFLGLSKSTSFPTPERDTVLTVEEMKWRLYKIYPLGDWQADVESWDDAKTRHKYLYYQSIGKITENK